MEVGAILPRLRSHLRHLRSSTELRCQSQEHLRLSPQTLRRGGIIHNLTGKIHRRKVPTRVALEDISKVFALLEIDGL